MYIFICSFFMFSFISTYNWFRSVNENGFNHPIISLHEFDFNGVITMCQLILICIDTTQNSNDQPIFSVISCNFSINNSRIIILTFFFAHFKVFLINKSNQLISDIGTWNRKSSRIKMIFAVLEVLLSNLKMVISMSSHWSNDDSAVI